MTATLRIAQHSAREGSPVRALGRPGSDRADQAPSARRPSALQRAAARALDRAGLSADAFVVVRGLAPEPPPGDGAEHDDLVDDWARGLEDALVGARGVERPGTADGDETLIVFSDQWAAEASYLLALADGDAPWWAVALPGLRREDEPPDIVSVLERWLEQNPAHALVQMEELIRARPGLAGLLTQDEADALTRVMLDRVTVGSIHGHAGPVDHDDHPVPSAIRVAADLMRRCSRLRAKQATSIAPQQRVPWVLAMLLAESPSTARLPAQTLLDVVAELLAAMDRPQSPVTVAPPAPVQYQRGAPVRMPEIGVGPAQTDVSAMPDAGVEEGAERVRTIAGGLLLLVRPLIRLDLLPVGPAAAGLLGDLGLAALRRVLDPLPPGVSGVFQERERTLLEVFAPECDWRRPVSEIPVADHATETMLDRLIAEIPEETGPAAAMHEVFPKGARPLSCEPDQRLARLLLRGGTLEVDQWSAELVWLPDAFDRALHRAGWDQDPGWVPWLGRVIRFRLAGSE